MLETVRPSLLETYFCRGTGSWWTSLEVLLQDSGPGTLQAKGMYACQMWQLPCSWPCKRSVIDSPECGESEAGSLETDVVKGDEVVRAAASRGVFLPGQSLSPRLGPGEEASKPKKGAWTHGRLSPQGLGPRRLGSRAFSGWGGAGRGGGRLRGRGSGRQVAASGCRSAARSAFQPADLAGLWGCSAGPKGDAVAAWAGNRTRASRVAGENPTTEPPMHR